ncbi:MAG TPA: peptidoglycan-binding domain-containing protein [Candidatus Paceibacterota bacterium]
MAKKALILTIFLGILALPVFVIAQSNAVFTVSLYRGLRHEQVTLLQRCLSSDLTIYAEGLVTGFFGSLTERAVQKFQERHNIIAYGTAFTTGYGFVGPKTRAVLNLICLSAKATPLPTIEPQPTPTIDPVLLESINQIKEAFINFDADVSLDKPGPGGCRTFKDCQDYCAIAANYKTCFEFK